MKDIRSRNTHTTKNIYVYLPKLLTMMKCARRMFFLKLITNFEEIKTGYTKKIIKIYFNHIS